MTRAIFYLTICLPLSSTRQVQADPLIPHPGPHGTLWEHPGPPYLICADTNIVGPALECSMSKGRKDSILARNSEKLAGCLSEDSIHVHASALSFKAATDCTVRLTTATGRLDTLEREHGARFWDNVKLAMKSGLAGCTVGLLVGIAGAVYLIHGM